jgi:hypothetical protein
MSEGATKWITGSRRSNWSVVSSVGGGFRVDRSHWLSHAHEQSLMNNQDQTLNMISGTLSTLHGQASLMGREAGEQNM